MTHHAQQVPTLQYKDLLTESCPCLAVYLLDPLQVNHTIDIWGDDSEFEEPRYRFIRGRIIWVSPQQHGLSQGYRLIKIQKLNP
jgi:hypothetical protein